MGEMLLSRPEIKHGIIAPAYFYALFENAMAAREGQTRTERREAMSALFEKFAAVAAANPLSQFDTNAFDASFLATPSKANYPFADPFLKWHIAQDAVNQGGAFLIMAWLDPVIALLAVLLLPVYFVAMKLVGRRIRL